MKLIISCIVLLFLAICVFAQSRPKPKPRFNPTGYFYANDVAELFPSVPSSGKRAMAGANGRIDIELKTTSFEVRPNGSLRWFSIAPEGSLTTEGEYKSTYYKLTSIKLKESLLWFETETIEGVSYTFTGRFLTLGIYHKLHPQGVALKGKLTRIRNGKIAEQAAISFRWYQRD